MGSGLRKGTSQTLLMCPFIPHVKHVLLMGQLRVECSSRAPQVKHWIKEYLTENDSKKIIFTHDHDGTLLGPVFAFHTATFADKARLLLSLCGCLKVTHRPNRLC